MGQVLVSENGFPVQCGECRLNMWWAGKGRARVRTCGCTPEPVAKPQPLGRLKSAPSTAAKGRRGERNTKRLLALAGASSTSTAGSGATGSRNQERGFDTDLTARLAGMKKRIEVKNLANVPGLASMIKMLARSDYLHVQGDGQSEGFWFLSHAQFHELASLAAEAAEAAR